MALKRKKGLGLLFIRDQPAENPEDLPKVPRYPPRWRYPREVFSAAVSGSIETGLAKGPAGKILPLQGSPEDETASNSGLVGRVVEGRAKYMG